MIIMGVSYLGLPLDACHASTMDLDSTIVVVWRVFNKSHSLYSDFLLFSQLLISCHYRQLYLETFSA